MAAIVLILAVAALVWGLVFARHGSLWTGAAAVVVLGYLLNHHFWHVAFGPISLTLGRVTLAGLTCLLVWRWRRGLLEKRPLTGADWLAALFVGYLTARFALTPSAPAALVSVSPMWRLIASVWMPAALYTVVRSADLSERSWKTLLAILSVLGVYLAGTGIAEVTQQWWAVYPRFIADPTLGLHFGRARGPALMSASLGVFLAICFWAAWFLWSRVSRGWQLVLMASMGLMCITLFLTYTRSTWLGLAGGLAVVPLLHFPRQWRPLLITGMLLVGTVGTIALGGKMLNMDRGDSASASHSAYQRATFLYVSLQMVAEDPLFGCGFGRFYDRKLPYLSDRRQQIELESIRGLDHHNTFLSILTETGLVGFTLFVGLLAAWGRAAWQLFRNVKAESWVRAHGLFTMAALITYVANAMFHDLTLSPSEQWLICLLTGATIGLQSRCRSLAAGLTDVPSSQTVGAKSAGWSLPPRKVAMFGMSIDVVDMPAAVQTVMGWCRDEFVSRCQYVVTPNVDHAVMYQSNSLFRDAYRQASLVLADGAPVVLASRILRRSLPERVAGSDLVPALFDEAMQTIAVNRPLRVFLLGAAPGVADRAAEAIHRRWSGVEVVGTSSPPMGFERNRSENERILEAVAACRPDLVLVGLGAPKQELWVHQHIDRLQARAALCIGATIDFLAGEKVRSPRWMQWLGLEWLHRVASEPSRLAKRYLRDAWVFPQLVWREWKNQF
ncbi:MAG: WecB/TagA/CpsF family glycosyltransferase [Planctomycetales bacterium]|nr:WecB/TagA/CpsF family glycosyltransferase [Planctomycetales bacterium]